MGNHRPTKGSGGHGCVVMRNTGSLFDEIKHRHTLNEVGDVAEGKYDWKIERGQDNGIKM